MQYIQFQNYCNITKLGHSSQYRLSPKCVSLSTFNTADFLLIIALLVIAVNTKALREIPVMTVSDTTNAETYSEAAVGGLGEKSLHNNFTISLVHPEECQCLLPWVIRHNLVAQHVVLSQKVLFVS